MNKLLKLSAISAAIAFAGTAHADPAETKGGIKIKTEDGRFEANVGGRIHFDLYNLDNDTDATFGSNTLSRQNSTYFRRIYLTLKGKAYGWNYKIEPDFAGNSTNGASAGAITCSSLASTPGTPSCTSANQSREIAFQDVYISTKLGPGELIIGQIKPFRGMEELTSSNDILMMERPFTSAAGLFGGGASREFQQGVFYKGDVDAANITWGAGVFSLRRDNTVATEGVGYNARFTWAPIVAEGSVLHTGLSYSYENPQNGTTNVGTSVTYAGRRGPSAALGSTTGGEHASTAGLELATAQGPFYAQAEYMSQKLEQVTGTPEQTIQAYYVQASFFLTGETKPYKKTEGFFGQAKPVHDAGAWELKARYDAAENQDLPVASVCGGADECKVTAITVGANYYVNPNVRFMLDYIMGKQERTAAGVTTEDEPKAITARAQFSF